MEDEGGFRPAGELMVLVPGSTLSDKVHERPALAFKQIERGLDSLGGAFPVSDLLESAFFDQAVRHKASSRGCV